jgi:2',3'-cyclic-nucleotide 2'-phosphodiesterase (5'-nucleotidase family)
MSISEDEPTVQLVEKLTANLKAKMEKPIGYTAAPLDARFTTVRLRESNMGNFVCDLMRYHYNADCAIIAAGTVRGDQIYGPGVIKLRDIMNCFPFEDPVVVIKVKGNALLEALENSVCKYPALEGRFAQVSNIFFSFDPNKPPGHRVLGDVEVVDGKKLHSGVKIGNDQLDLNKEYVMSTRGYSKSSPPLLPAILWIADIISSGSWQGWLRISPSKIRRWRCRRSNQ